MAKAEDKYVAKNAVCRECGRPLEPIGRYVKDPKDPSKLCCRGCGKVYKAHEVGLFVRDVAAMGSEEEVPW